MSDVITLPVKTDVCPYCEHPVTQHNDYGCTEGPSTVRKRGACICTRSRSFLARRLMGEY